MQTTASTRSSIEQRNQCSDNAGGTDARSAGKNKGFVHLLHEMTLESVLAQQLDEYRRFFVEAFLVDGLVPGTQGELDYLALWMVRNAQADLLNALLGVRELVVPVNDEATASGLLRAMQSGSSFSGLKVQLDSTTRKEVLDAVIPLLTQAFSANTSLTALVLFSNDYGARGLQPLFDVLAGVKHLELVTVEEILHPGDLTVMAILLAKNKTVRALELNNLGEGQAGTARVADASTAWTDLFRHLGDQPLLEHLSLSGVPEHCQSLLGNCIGSSYSLGTLRIKLHGLTATKALVAGLGKNTSVEKLYLNLTEMADGLLPLLDAVADGKEQLAHVALTTCRSRADAMDSQHIGKLIARNDSLASLVWAFSDQEGVDLGRLGAALKENRRLESLYLIRHIDTKELPDPEGCTCDWVDTSMVPSLLEGLNKNRTLTTLFLSDSAPLVNATPSKFPMLQQVLDRNIAWQVFACSDAYISGAVQGFFTSLGLPVDTALVTADCLLQHTPRVAAGALALVNKATYESALGVRRNAHPVLLNQRLAAMPDFDFSKKGSVDDLTKHHLYFAEVADWDDSSFEDMIELLNGINATGGDYSADDLRRIANHPSLGAALLVMMKRSESSYLDLVERFCSAAGKDVIRSIITGSMTGPSRTSAQQWHMLQQSFEPDQQHLARFVENAFDYDRIDSLPASLFIGYNVAPDPDRKAGREFTSWCIKNQAPGALIAWHDQLESNYIEIDAGKFSGKFLKEMMEKIPLLTDLTDLHIKGAFMPDDALVLQRALSAESGLLDLLIDGSTGGVAFDLIMQGLMINKGIKQVALCNLASSRSSQICTTVAAVLQGNGTIESLSIDVFGGDPELDDLEQLAMTDARLEITFNSEVESSDSEEASFEAEGSVIGE